MKLAQGTVDAAILTIEPDEFLKVNVKLSPYASTLRMNYGSLVESIGGRTTEECQDDIEKALPTSGSSLNCHHRIHPSHVTVEDTGLPVLHLLNQLKSRHCTFE